MEKILQYKNGYGLDQLEYEKLVDRFYGFEEYYYYKDRRHYDDYKFVINLIDDIRNNKPMDTAYKNAIIGYWISFKRLPRVISPKQLAFSITDACQLKCRHCYNQDVARHNKFMTYDEFEWLYHRHQEIIKRFIHYHPVNECDITMAIEGGEPSLNPDAAKMVKFGIDRNMTVQFLTNGINLSDELIETFKLCKNPFKMRVQVSIDGLKNTHDYIRGEGSFEKSLESIIKMINHGICVNTNTVVHNKNYQELKKIKSLFREYYHINSGDMVYVDKNNEILKPTFIKDVILYETTQYEITCSAGNNVLITPDGGYRFCGKLATPNIANYFTDTIEEWLEKVRKEIIRYRSVPIYCFDCELYNDCYGGLSCNRYCSSNLYNLPDYDCIKSNKKVFSEMYEV